VIRKGAGAPRWKAIVEEKSATPAQKRVAKSILASILRGPSRFSAGSATQDRQRPSRVLLTDMAACLASQSKVVAMKTTNPAEVLGSNTRAEMMEIDGLLRMAKCQQLMTAGASTSSHRPASSTQMSKSHRHRD